MGVSGVSSADDEHVAMHAIQTVFPKATTARAGEEDGGFAA
jgi:hypothetical protein